VYNSHFEIMENGYLAPLNKYIPFSDQAHATRSPEKRGCALNFPNLWVFSPYVMIFQPVFNGFCLLLGDLEPDSRPDLGRKF
jgi:hypothetical protein